MSRDIVGYKISDILMIEKLKKVGAQHAAPLPVGIETFYLSDNFPGLPNGVDMPIHRTQDAPSGFY
jgi:hypothetical protein